MIADRRHSQAEQDRSMLEEITELLEQSDDARIQQIIGMSKQEILDTLANKGMSTELRGQLRDLFLAEENAADEEIHQSAEQAVGARALLESAEQENDSEVEEIVAETQQHQERVLREATKAVEAEQASADEEEIARLRGGLQGSGASSGAQSN